MASYGTRKTNNPSMGKGYQKDPMYSMAKAYAELATNVLNENGVNLMMGTADMLNDKPTLEAMRRFFIEESCDKEELTAEEYDEHVTDMENLFLNDREALNEYTSVAVMNPVLGMSFPIHKNILINCPFDKGAIQKAVAAAPRFTVDMEYRYLVTPDGREIDMWKDQNKMTAAIDATVPYYDIEMSLPERGTTDVIAAIGGGAKDNVSIDTRITSVKVKYKENGTGDQKEVWLKCNLRFQPGYGEYDRILTGKVVLPPEVAVALAKEAHPSDFDESKVIDHDVIQGYQRKNRFAFNSINGFVTAVKLTARRDVSNGLVDTCSVAWKVRTDVVEIDTAIPFNVPIAPEEVKDIAALYNVNQLTKVMSMIKLAMENYKDDHIKKHLDESWETMDPMAKFTSEFDFAPRHGYYEDHIHWRENVFMDSLESLAQDAFQYLNDPNMTVTVFGRPDIIRKIGPTNYEYKTPQAIGPVKLEYEKSVVSSNNKTYQFISSQKLDRKYLGGTEQNNELIVILSPKNTERICYRIYDYQLYVSNEIRNAANPTLPAVHAFERWKFFEYQPVQARVEILNPSGILPREQQAMPVVAAK